LEAVGISREGGPIGLMLVEHQEGRRLVAGMKAATTRFQNGEADASRELSHLASDYVSLLNYHIGKENEALFPLAKKHLSRETLTNLKDGFDRIESERIGAGRHEAFHAMLFELERAYLQ
jgi:hemerythrin-like domain-containing protein